MTQPRLLIRCVAGLVVTVLAQGCAAEAPHGAAGSDVAADPGAADPPRGAISVGEQLYQVPIGADDDGCPMFRLYSPTKLVAQVIYYRDPAGGFTTSKQDAACRSGPPD